MAQKIQMRRDSVENWLDVNPILARGEWGVAFDGTSTDVIAIKIGDGESDWESLQSLLPINSSDTGEGGAGPDAVVATQAGFTPTYLDDGLEANVGPLSDYTGDLDLTEAASPIQGPGASRVAWAVPAGAVAALLHLECEAGSEFIALSVVGPDGNPVAGTGTQNAINPLILFSGPGILNFGSVDHDAVSVDILLKFDTPAVDLQIALSSIAAPDMGVSVNWISNNLTAFDSLMSMISVQGLIDFINTGDAASDDALAAHVVEPNPHPVYGLADRIIDVSRFIAVSAVDGTASEAILITEGASEGDGIIPAGWIRTSGGDLGSDENAVLPAEALVGKTWIVPEAPGSPSHHVYHVPASGDENPTGPWLDLSDTVIEPAILAVESGMRWGGYGLLYQLREDGLVLPWGQTANNVAMADDGYQYPPEMIFDIINNLGPGDLNEFAHALLQMMKDWIPLTISLNVTPGPTDDTFTIPKIDCTRSVFAAFDGAGAPLASTVSIVDSENILLTPTPGAIAVTINGIGPRR